MHPADGYFSFSSNLENLSWIMLVICNLELILLRFTIVINCL